MKTRNEAPRPTSRNTQKPTPHELDGLAIVSSDTLKSSGEKWEIACGKEEGKPVRGIWGHTDDRTEVTGLKTMVWTWENIASWIDSL